MGTSYYTTSQMNYVAMVTDAGGVSLHLRALNRVVIFVERNKNKVVSFEISGKLLPNSAK